MQGNEFAAAAQAIRDGRPLAEVPVTMAERLLLEFVATLTRHAHRITDVTGVPAALDPRHDSDPNVASA